MNIHKQTREDIYYTGGDKITCYFVFHNSISQ
jgi:hypothetical protein